MNLKNLQNGSDIRGVSLEGEINEPVNLTPEVVNLLGKAFVKWLNIKGFENPTVAVGMDSRITGPLLKEAFCTGMVSIGARVFDFGLASTPAMFMATISEKINADGAVILTASHLPYNRNGLKFFTKNGGLDKNDISDILTMAEKGEFETAGNPSHLEQADFISEYAGSLVSYIRRTVNDPANYDCPLAGLKIIVDAGNGSGGFFAEKILRPLGADTRGSQFLEPDGMFPNHIPNPENEEAMHSICNAVLKEKADLGIIFDTDVDRAAIADNKGKPVNKNQLIALISAVILKENPGSIVVTDSITSEGLTTFIEGELKGTHHRFKRGYKNVINEAIRLNEDGKSCHLAIETSGHAALKENYFLDDGAFLVAKLLAEMAILKNKNANLFSLISKLPVPAESIEFRYSIDSGNFTTYGLQVIEDLREWVKTQNDWVIQEPNHEGVRVRCTREDERGWFLIRLSLHDPVIPINVESDIAGGVNNITSRLRKFLSRYTKIKKQ
jgi:phosphomannomutase